MIKTKRILLVDMDDVLCDWSGKVTKVTGIPVVRRPDGMAKWTEYQHQIVSDLEKTEHFYLQIDPIPYAVKAIKYLNKYFEIYVVSTPSWNNPSSFTDKRLWIETHFGTLLDKKLILTHRKDLIIGDIIIDDRLVNGVENFKGQIIQFGTEDFPDWKYVVSYLMKNRTR